MLAPSSTAPLRVALLSPCFWPEVRRGTERFVSELAAGLLARGQRPSLITSHPGLPSRRVEDGVPILRLPRPPIEPLLRRYLEPYLSHVPMSYLALGRGEFDVAHAVYPADALAAARWRTRPGRVAILSYMGIPDDEWLDAQRGRRAILGRAADGCDAVVVLSDHAAAALRRSLGLTAHVIAPGVDLAAFRPAAQRAPEPTIVCSAAADVPRKNVPLLLEAFTLVREQHRDARLVLSRPRAPGWAARAGVDVSAPGVQWRDLDDRAELAKAYGEAWVTALPSVDEAFGLVLVESLACGTPVVGYAHGAIPEIIDRPQIGRLFDALDPGALAQALLDCFALAADQATASSCRGRAQQFSAGRCTEAYLALYRDLLI